VSALGQSSERCVCFRLLRVSVMLRSEKLQGVPSVWRLIMTDSHNTHLIGGDHSRQLVDRSADQPEVSFAPGEVAGEARERNTASIMRAAARRDTVADHRDDAAEQRDFDAAVQEWMQISPGHDASRARTEARKDRVASKNDRRAAKVDRTELAAAPASARPTGMTLEEAIAGAVKRIKASSQPTGPADGCIRCHRAVPDPTSAEFRQWDPVGDDADFLICPNCLTHDEETAAG
jgi:hypothetical protein